MNPVEFEQIALTKMRLAARRHLSREIADTAEPSVVIDYIADEIALQLRAELYGRSDTRTFTERRDVPASWWDHAKSDAAEWLSRRHLTARAGLWLLGRVRTKALTLKIDVTCDQFAPTLPPIDGLDTRLVIRYIPRSVEWTDGEDAR